MCTLLSWPEAERFWPLSTKTTPKPFLNLVGDRTMIQMTVDRVRFLVPEEERSWSRGRPSDVAKKQLRQLADGHFIEPAGRDTAPCIGSLPWLCGPVTRMRSWW
jgi:mannose-1-phosphate guanylyltransferase